MKAPKEGRTQGKRKGQHEEGRIPLAAIVAMLSHSRSPAL